MMTKQTLKKPEEIKRVIPLADGRQLPLTRPLVMGILNVTPDSFSDGGLYASPGAAVDHAVQMFAEGADIVDVGGESSRPGALPVDAQSERKRILPVIEAIRLQSDVCLSVDTYRASTAEAALDSGADIVNDISALRFDPAMASLVARKKAPLILMHMQGSPGDMQDNPTYDDCVDEIAAFFAERVEFCRANGIDRTKLILDPGLGFGKRLSHNLEILAGLKRFRELSLPLLIGASRKSFISMLAPESDRPDQRLGGSLAAAVAAVIAGAKLIRVHDVAPTVQALKVVQGIKTAG